MPEAGCFARRKMIRPRSRAVRRRLGLARLALGQGCHVGVVASCRSHGRGAGCGGGGGRKCIGRPGAGCVIILLRHLRLLLRHPRLIRHLCHLLVARGGRTAARWGPAMCRPAAASAHARTCRDGCRSRPGHRDLGLPSRTAVRDVLLRHGLYGSAQACGSRVSLHAQLCSARGGVRSVCTRRSLAEVFRANPARRSPHPGTRLRCANWRGLRGERCTCPPLLTSSRLGAECAKQVPPENRQVQSSASLCTSRV